MVKNEDAVSPVVGVMLIVVVTIVIAALVAVFASSTVTDTEPVPTVTLGVGIYPYWNYGSEGCGTVTLKSLNGEPVDMSKISVTLYAPRAVNPEADYYLYDSDYGEYTISPDYGEILKVYKMDEYGLRTGGGAAFTGLYLEPGEEINLAYIFEGGNRGFLYGTYYEYSGMEAIEETRNEIESLIAGTLEETGVYSRVIVTYDEKSVLFDKEVEWCSE